jgi:hypothetical protein
MSGSATARGSAEPAPPARPKLRWSGDVNLGHCLQAGMIGVGLICWLVAGQSKTETVAASVQSLQGQVAQQNQDTRNRMDDGFRRLEGALGAVQSQVVNLPDLAARVRALEEAAKRDGEAITALHRYLDERRGIADQRFQALEQRAIESSTDRADLRRALDNLHRASGVNLPGSRGAR